MKNKSIIILLLASIFITACNKSEKHTHGNSEAIQLNEGKQWIVVSEMMAYIQQIETDVSSFEGTELSDHEKLAESIDSNLEKLTSNCTMTGQAHDELHKWLLPFLELADTYNKSEDLKEAQKHLADIKTSFATFNTYFK
ncbi:MAG: hypothetical protein HKP14_01315 [Bacteroidia bacterium]|nr:hypothetical protein [Bacteroidia bacterium]